MITAELVSGPDPRLVQIVVDETPVGEAWTLIGRIADVSAGTTPGDGLLPGPGMVASDTTITPGSYQWQVPGGFGVGDGEQLTLVDNLAPGNRDVIYSLVSASGEESSTPLVVQFPKNVVLQSPDGRRTLSADLLAGSTDLELPTNVSLFRVPNRTRSVSRYDVIGDVVSALHVLLPLEDKTPFRDLLGPGGPILYRLGMDVVDLDLVAAIQVTRISSTRVWQTRKLREWVLEYTIVDNPYADVRLGAFTWDDFDAAFAGRPWTDFDAAFDMLDWDAFDRADWTVV